jgi:hypothetical protein
VANNTYRFHLLCTLVDGRWKVWSQDHLPRTLPGEVRRKVKTVTTSPPRTLRAIRGPRPKSILLWCSVVLAPESVFNHKCTTSGWSVGQVVVGLERADAVGRGPVVESRNRGVGEGA